MPDPLVQAEALPIGGRGPHALGWWGVMGIVATEASLFAYLLFVYFYAAVNVDGAWPPSGPPHLTLASLNTLILLASSATLWLAERWIDRDRRNWAICVLVVTIVLGGVFTGLQLVEWSNKDFTPVSNTYGSVFFTITGTHMAHVCVGLVVLAFLLLWTVLGYFDARQHNGFSVGAIYWHFVDVVWLFIYASLYLSPHLGLGHGG